MREPVLLLLFVLLLLLVLLFVLVVLLLGWRDGREGGVDSVVFLTILLIISFVVHMRPYICADAVHALCAIGWGSEKSDTLIAEVTFGATRAIF